MRTHRVLTILLSVAILCPSSSVRPSIFHPDAGRDLLLRLLKDKKEAATLSKDKDGSWLRVDAHPMAGRILHDEIINSTKTIVMLGWSKGMVDSYKEPRLSQVMTSLQQLPPQTPHARTTSRTPFKPHKCSPQTKSRSNHASLQDLCLGMHCPPPTRIISGRRS